MVVVCRMLGLASGLETISGQAFGAQQYEKIGTQTFTAMFCLVIATIPISILWLYSVNFLIFLGQDPLIAIEAGRFLTWLIPSLLGYAFLQPLVRFYQMQSLIVPMIMSSCITLCFHIPVCWALVFNSRLGNVGGAVAMGLSIWLNVGILGLYLKYSPSCAKARSPISLKILDGVKEFFAFAVPSALMICLEWWSYELLVLLAALLPNPQLETSVLAVCLSTTTTLYSIPEGLAAAASTRISNALGAGDSHRARVTVTSVMLFAAVDGIVVSSTLFATRKVFGYVFTNEKEVVQYVASMAPLVCLSVIFDSIQGTIAGIARGSGWQHMGAYVNLAAYYLFGVPIAALLAFWWNLSGRGLWLGILCGVSVQTIMYGTITICTNWDKQAAEARKRQSLGHHVR